MHNTFPVAKHLYHCCVHTCRSSYKAHRSYHRSPVEQQLSQFVQLLSQLDAVLTIHYLNHLNTPPAVFRCQDKLTCSLSINKRGSTLCNALQHCLYYIRIHTYVCTSITIGIYLQIILLLGDGDCYTEAQCDAIVMCGNNHWIITPNLARSIQIDLWPGGPKSYLWQPVIASPVIERTVTLTTASLHLLLCVLLGVDTEATSHPAIAISTPHWRGPTRSKQLSVALPSCLLDDWGGDHWLP